MRTTRKEEVKDVPGREEIKLPRAHAPATTPSQDTSPTAAWKAKPLAAANYEERQQDLSTGTAGHQTIKEPDTSATEFPDLILHQEEPRYFPVPALASALAPALAPALLQAPVQEEDYVYLPSASLDLDLFLEMEMDSIHYATSGSLDSFREA